MFTRRYRRKRYPKLLQAYPLSVLSPRERIHHLAQIWRRVNRGDFNTLDWRRTSALQLSTSTTCLPALVSLMERHTQLSASDDWDAIDTINKQPLNVQTHTLDQYLATEEMLTIDVEAYLRRFSSMTQILNCECEQYYADHSSEYPARAAGYLLPDMVAFTTTLLNLESVVS